MNSDPNTAKCPACASTLDLDAMLCPVCKTYRARWRNWLPHAGAMIALVTFVLSGATFVATNAAKFLREASASPRVVLVDLNTTRDMVLLNSGDQEALVTAIDFECPDIGYFTQVPINKLIAPGQLLTLDTKGDGGLLVNIDTPDAWSAVVKNLAKKIPEGTKLAFFTKDNAAVALVQRKSALFHSLEGSARIQYISAKGGEKKTIVVDDLVVLLFLPIAQQSVPELDVRSHGRPA